MLVWFSFDIFYILYFIFYILYFIFYLIYYFFLNFAHLIDSKIRGIIWTTRRFMVGVYVWRNLFASFSIHFVSWIIWLGSHSAFRAMEIHEEWSTRLLFQSYKYSFQWQIYQCWIQSWFILKPIWTNLFHWIKITENEGKVGLMRDLLAQVLSGLAVIHHFNVTHRDIKPGNILSRSRTPDDGPLMELCNDDGL